MTEKRFEYVLTKGRAVLKNRDKVRAVKEGATGDDRCVALCFGDVPGNVTVILERCAPAGDGRENRFRDTVYVSVKDNVAVIDPFRIIGDAEEIRLRVTVADLTSPDVRFIADGLRMRRVERSVLVFADDGDLGRIASALSLENKELREQMEILEAKVKEFEETLQSVMEGYDLV